MTALAKTPGSVWQAASITVYFCWSAADGWEPWKLQVTFRKLFISWWKCKNRLCQLLNFWGRQGLKWSLFEQRNMSTSWWIKSDLCLSLPVSFSLCLSLRFSKVFNLSSLPFSICVCVCVTLSGVLNVPLVAFSPHFGDSYVKTYHLYPEQSRFQCHQALPPGSVNANGKSLAEATNALIFP